MWWSRDSVPKESKEARKETAQFVTQQNGLVAGMEDGGVDGVVGTAGAGAGGGAQGAGGRRHSAANSERSEHSHKKKGHHTLKGTATAAKFVARLSPKSARRYRETQTRTALTKVSYTLRARDSPFVLS